MDKKITGRLFAILAGVGTMSEGYHYYLEPLDEYAQRWKEVPISKRTEVWKNDPQLHRFVDKKVEITGEIIEVHKSMIPASISVVYKEIREVD